MRAPSAASTPGRTGRRSTSGRSDAGGAPAEGGSAVLDAARGSIAYRFEGRDLNLVVAPPPAGGAVRFRVLLDGGPPGDDHGLDVDGSGEGTVDEPRMYQLVRRRGPIRPGTVEITFRNAGVRAYVF